MRIGVTRGDLSNKPKNITGGDVKWSKETEEKTVAEEYARMEVSECKKSFTIRIN